MKEQIIILLDELIEEELEIIYLFILNFIPT